MITVITPVYNGERFIEFCIKNVIEQNCSNVEHIIVDGNSTDGTVEIIEEYAAKYSHIRWVSEPDRGQSDAMNKGIAMSKGEIISFLNVDDYYEPNILNRILELFDTLPEPTLLVGNCNIWNDDENLAEVNTPNNLKFTELLKGHCITPFPLNPSAYFYHTVLHKEIGLYEIEDHYSMDIDFLLRAVQVANTKYQDEIWGNHRQISGTKTVRDKKSGNIKPRIRNLLKKHRKSLPLTKRLYLKAIYLFGDFILETEIFYKIKYFCKNPTELLPSLTKKISAFRISP